MASSTEVSRFSYVTLALSLVLCAPALAQVGSACPHVCTGTYALCIAASCDETGRCGVYEDGRVCDQAGLDAGTCGPCYIFTGESCSVFERCDRLEEGELYSLYSEELLDDFGFKWATVSDEPIVMNCMDGPCTPTGRTVTLNGQEIETATCQCKRWGYDASVNVYLQTKSCSGISSEAIWSTAPPPIHGASCNDP